ncbi:hypothetical protein D9M70_422210 [compost metagenome]
MRLGDRLQAAGKRGHEFGRVARLAKRLARKRLQHGQCVLDPMIELLEQEPSALRRSLLVGDIDRHADERKRIALAVTVVHAAAAKQPATGIANAEHAVIFIVSLHRLAKLGESRAAVVDVDRAEDVPDANRTLGRKSEHTFQCAVAGDRT